jgi:hypothetical protein
LKPQCGSTTLHKIGARGAKIHQRMNTINKPSDDGKRKTKTTSSTNKNHFTSEKRPNNAGEEK